MNRSFQLLTISIFLLLILPWIIQDGMFMDGMIYATVARNLSLGIGSWWHLHLTDYLSPQYYDQPPLTIWITSYFFKLFGYSMYTERIYSFSTALINLILIKVLWRKITIHKPEYIDLWWMPVLLWIIPPVCFWSFTNNMEENTMSIFILSSVYFMFDAIQRKTKKIIPVLLMAACIFLSAMCKGIQGAFTLVGFIAYAYMIDKTFFKTSLKYTSILVAALGILILSVFLYDPAREYFIGYYHTRILSTFTNSQTATTDNRFYLLFRLISEEILPVLICISVIYFQKRLNSTVQNSTVNKKYATVFLLVALAGTLPLLVTAEQRRFYLVPTLPFYSIALSFLIAEPVHLLTEKFNNTRQKSIIRNLSFVILIATAILTAANYGRTKRDNEMLSDIHAIGKVIPANSVIGIDPELYRTWVLHLYFQRYYGISLDPTETNKTHSYYLKKDQALPDPKFIISELKLSEYFLFERK